MLFSVFAMLFYVFATSITGKIFPRRFLGNIMTENEISARDFSGRRYKDATKLKPIDILILGSSHAYRGYDIRIFKNEGFKAYNLGSSAQPLIISNFIFKNYSRLLNPKIIIIDIYPVLLSNLGGESQINLLPLFYNKINFVKSSFQTFDIRVFNSLLFFQAFGNTNLVKDRKLKNERYIDGGYISSIKTSKDLRNYNRTNLRIEEKNITALKSMVTVAKKRGIKVILFQAPLPKNRYKSYTNNREIDSLMQSIGTYYNYNEFGFLPQDCFMDDSHINQKGVDIYNQWVLDKIKNNE